MWNEKVVGGHPHFITGCLSRKSLVLCALRPDNSSGAGGFLQNILYGYVALRYAFAAHVGLSSAYRYGGLRILPDSLRIKPLLPPDVTSVIFRQVILFSFSPSLTPNIGQIWYMGTQFTLSYNNTVMSLTQNSPSPAPFYAQNDNGVSQLQVGVPWSVPVSEAYLSTTIQK